MESTVLVLTIPEPKITSHQRPQGPDLNWKSQEQLRFTEACAKQHSLRVQAHSPRLPDEQTGRTLRSHHFHVLEPVLAPRPTTTRVLKLVLSRVDQRASAGAPQSPQLDVDPSSTGSLCISQQQNLCFEINLRSSGREGIYMYLGLIHVVWQKATQHC